MEEVIITHLTITIMVMIILITDIPVRDPITTLITTLCQLTATHMGQEAVEVMEIPQVTDAIFMDTHETNSSTCRTVYQIFSFDKPFRTMNFSVNLKFRLIFIHLLTEISNSHGI